MLPVCFWLIAQKRIENYSHAWMEHTQKYFLRWPACKKWADFLKFLFSFFFADLSLSCLHFTHLLKFVCLSVALTNRLPWLLAKQKYSQVSFNHYQCALHTFTLTSVGVHTYIHTYSLSISTKIRISRISLSSLLHLHSEQAGYPTSTFTI